MRTLLAALVVAGLFASTGAQAMTYEEKLAACGACHGEKGISETAEIPSLAGMPYSLRGPLAAGSGSRSSVGHSSRTFGVDSSMKCSNIGCPQSGHGFSPD